MGMTERLDIVMTNTEPLNKHVIWLKDDMLKRWTGVGWKNIGGEGSSDNTQTIDIVDNLISTDKSKALSANQGRVLAEKIKGINTDFDLSNIIKIGNGLTGHFITNDNQWFIDHKLIGTQMSINIKKLNFGDTIEVSDIIKFDENGHITSISKQQLTLPDAPTIVALGLATPSSDGLMSANDKAKLDSINNRALSNSTTLENSTYNALGEITTDTTFTINLHPYVAEYAGEFSFGDTVYTITFPSDIVWAVEPAYQPNKKYQFSIMNNLGIMCEFPLTN